MKYSDTFPIKLHSFRLEIRSIIFIRPSWYRRKLYRKFLFNIIPDVSLSSFWRKKLFDSKQDTIFILDSETLKDTIIFQKEKLENHRLTYIVRKGEIDPEEENMIRFWFTSFEFPEITDCSWNNPECL